MIILYSFGDGEHGVGGGEGGVKSCRLRFLPLRGQGFGGNNVLMLRCGSSLAISKHASDATLWKFSCNFKHLPDVTLWKFPVILITLLMLRCGSYLAIFHTLLMLRCGSSRPASCQETN